jgi:anti-sigma factor RsiW
MKGCSEIRERLSAMLDGMVTPDEARELQEHLSACPSCAASFEDLKKVVVHLQTLEQVEPPPWMTQKVMAGVRSLDAESDRAGFFRRLFSLSHMKIPVGAVAAAILAVTTYFIFEGMLSDMPIEKTDSAVETGSKVPDSRKVAAPGTVAPDLPVRKPAAAAPAPAKPPVGKAAPAAQEPAAGKGQKEATGNRLWQEGPPAAKTEAGPLLKKGGDYTPPAPAPSVSRGGGIREPAGTAAPEHSKAADISVQGRQDKAASAPGEYPATRAKKSRAYVPPKSETSFHLSAANPAASAGQVMTFMRECRGRNVRKDTAGGKIIVRGELSAAWLGRFFDRLKETGELREKDPPATAPDGYAPVTVEITAAG